jgi:2-polyprenyl-3-methyl-5-hydroxy-6-metoxy-1,4-benzoquinol methylase
MAAARRGVVAKARGAGRFKKEKMLKLAGPEVLMVGCGKGKYLEFCHSSGRRAFGIDISAEYAAEASKRSGGRAAVADACSLPFPNAGLDTVTLWDVLEHVPDDCAALREAVRVARKNILFSVPAEDFHPDHSAGVTFRTYTDQSHRRYYDNQRLENLLSLCAQQDFTIERFDRVRPALLYKRVGIPRFVLSALDKLFWLLSTKSDSFKRNYFVEVRLHDREEAQR